MGKPDLDLSAFASSNGSRAGRPCRVALVLQGLEGERRELLEEALTRPGNRVWAVPDTRVAATVRDWGFELGASSVGLHRRGECSCPRI